jgi:hypothetical protein
MWASFYAERLFRDARLDALHLVERELLQRHAALGGERDDAAADVMGVAERHTQRLHQIGWHTVLLRPGSLRR